MLLSNIFNPLQMALLYALCTMTQIDRWSLRLCNKFTDRHTFRRMTSSTLAGVCEQICNNHSCHSDTRNGSLASSSSSSPSAVSYGPVKKWPNIIHRHPTVVQLSVNLIFLLKSIRITIISMFIRETQDRSHFILSDISYEI